MASMGQVAYEAYCTTAGGVSLVSGDPLPSWPMLPDAIREAWHAAALAVADVTHG